MGYFTHNSAPFLPWHRYFLHIYETALRERCHYTGSLVYWDWTLDWEHLELAPVFNSDPETGFGTDGNVTGEITVGKTGRCVVDGSFKDIVASYYDVKPKPHCLSRGFRDDDGHLGALDGRNIRPDSIEEVLSLDDYEKFVKEMESKIHDTIPFGIGGDFETFTAPYGMSNVFLSPLRMGWRWLTTTKTPFFISITHNLTAYGGSGSRSIPRNDSTHTVATIIDILSRWQA